MSLGGAIIIAEDNNRDFEVIAETLNENGYSQDILQFQTGEECLDYLSGDVPKPELLLLDLNLPGLDGRDVLAEIKADRRLNLIPVSVFTTSSNPRDIAFCYSHGVSSYHLKPLKLTEFRHTVKVIAEFWLRSAVLPTKANMEVPP